MIRSRSHFLRFLPVPCLIFAGCGGFNGVVAPVLTSITPSTIAAGSAAFTLTATGTGFVNGTTLLWNGTSLPTTVKSSTQLTAPVSAGQAASAGTVAIRAMKPDSTTSGTLSLTITGVGRLALQSISPSSVAAGSASFTLTATGSGFVTGASMVLNGGAIPTIFDSATQLHATVAGSAITTPGTISVVISNPDNTMSSALPITVTGTSIPVPTLASITPNASAADITSPLTLTANGTNFITGSQLVWNGVAMTTAFVSSTQLTASIPASDFADADIGTANVFVLNPNQTASNEQLFTITVSPQTAPNLVSISPNRSATGDAGFTLILNGNLFASGATAYFGTLALPTTVVNSTQARAQVPAYALTAVAEIPVTIQNPQSKPSNAIPYLVGIAVYPGEVNDVAWDPQRNLLYLSQPSSSFFQADTVIAIDPLAPTAPPLWTWSPGPGSDPDRMALSADGKYLYVGLDGSGTVQQLVLGNQDETPGITIPLGSDPNLGPYYAIDLQVSPLNSSTIAVARGIPNQQSIIVALGGVAVYDGVAQRPQVVDPATQPVKALLDTIQWSADGTTIFAANNETASGDFYKLAVANTGVVLPNGNDFPGTFPLADPYIHLDPASGLLYGDDGQVVNSATAAVMGNNLFPGIMTPDPSTQTAYFVAHPAFDSNVQDYYVLEFALASLAPGPTLHMYDVEGIPQHVVRWNDSVSGTSGLAFSTKAINCFSALCNVGDGRLYIVSLPF